MTVWALVATTVLFGGVNLQEMVDGIRPGQTLIIPNGTYVGPLLENRNFPSPATIQAQTPGEVILIDNPATDQPCWIRRCSGLRFEGITFVSKKSHALHIDGDPMPKPILSSDLEFHDCTMVSLGKHYCVKLSQSRKLLFDRCYFYVPDHSQANDHLGGGFDAVAVDGLVIRYCRFDIRKPGTCTLMIKGGSRRAIVRDSIFECPSAPTFFLAGPTDPSFYTRPAVEHELEDLLFQDNTVYFQDSQGENLHGTWDSLGRGRFIGNTFTNVGQMLFVGKRTQQELLGCLDIEFRDNEIHLRPSGFASPYNALITSQTFQPAAGGPEQPVLPPSQFQAAGNFVYSQQTTRPEMSQWISKGFTFEPEGEKTAGKE